MKRSILTVGLALLIAAGVAAVAVATSRHGSKWAPRRAVHAVRLSAFDRPFRATRVQRAQRSEIRREFRQAPRGSAVASAVFDTARPVTIPGTQTNAWIAPDGGGGACTFIDDPLGGYGSSCATPDVIGNGQAATILVVGDGSPLAGKALVALVEPDGAAAPVVHRADGSTDALPVSNNLATGLVSPGDTISSAGNQMVVPKPDHRACAAAREGEQFRRCS